MICFPSRAFRGSVLGLMELPDAMVICLRSCGDFLLARLKLGDVLPTALDEALGGGRSGGGAVVLEVVTKYSLFVKDLSCGGDSERRV